MSVKKLTFLVASLLGVASSSVMASSQAVVNRSTKFYGSLDVAGIVSKDKKDVELTSYLIDKIFNQLAVVSSTSTAPLHSVTDGVIDGCQQTGSTDVNSPNGAAADIAPNIQKIISSLYENPNLEDDTYTKVEAHKDLLSNGSANFSNLSLNTEISFSLGAKLDDRFVVGLRPFVEIPMKGKTSTSTFAKSETTTSKDSSSGSSSGSSSSSNSSNSTSSTSKDERFNVTVKNKLSYGFAAFVQIYLNRCLYAEIDGGLKLCKCELDMTKINTNLLGTEGTSTYDSAKKIKAENTTNAEVLEGAFKEKYNTLNASAARPFLGAGMGFVISDHFAVFVKGGYIFGGTATLKNGSSKITNQHFRLNMRGSFYGKLGVSVIL